MRSPPNDTEAGRRSVGTTLLVIFFTAGALICLVTMLALAFPGGFLEPTWRLKSDARVEFQKIGGVSVALMAVVGAACGLAAFGLARNAEWGRRLAIGVLTVNLVGDSLNALLRHNPAYPHRPADRRVNDLVSAKEKALRGTSFVKSRTHCLKKSIFWFTVERPYA